MTAPGSRFREIFKALAPFALGVGIWFTPIPEGLTREAWHLFAIFAAAIFAVIINALPLLTSALLAGSFAVLSATVEPAKVFAGFANQSVLLVVVAFLVAQAVVKCGLGRRISLHVVSSANRRSGWPTASSSPMPSSRQASRPIRHAAASSSRSSFRSPRVAGRFPGTKPNAVSAAT